MISIDRHAWLRFVSIARPFFQSERRWSALGAPAILIALLLTLNGLNVLNSYVGRDFMTAISERETEQFLWNALLYLAVFAGSTVVAVLYQYTQDRLALRWREWLTDYLLEHYLSGQAYYRLHLKHEVDNPDQRLAEDVKTFTTMTLSFVLMILNATITALAFAGVLWSITPWLLVVAVAYPGLRTVFHYGSCISVVSEEPKPPIPSNDRAAAVSSSYSCFFPWKPRAARTFSGRSLGRLLGSCSLAHMGNPAPAPSSGWGRPHTCATKPPTAPSTRPHKSQFGHVSVT